MTALPPRIALLALLATLLACGAWPYHEMLSWLPWGADASKWVGQGSLDDPRWMRWVWDSKHFVGYRPITALSFVLNHALTGYSALGYRLTDLALHLATGGLLFAAWRALTGDRSALGLLPVVLLCAHPATEEVVPFPARRSYLLAMTFGLSALLLWIKALCGDGPSRLRGRLGLACLSALSLLLAVLSNEVAYVFAPLLPLWALLQRAPLKPALLAHLPVVAAVGAAIAARYAVLGTLGGYQRRLFAVVTNGIPAWRELPDWRPGAILEACWQYLLLPHGVSGQVPLLQGRPGLVAASVGTAWLLGVALVPWERDGGRRRTRLWLLAWLLGSLAIVVLSQTWFWRQAHALLFPYALLVGLGLTDALRALWTRRKTPRALPLPLASLAVGGLLALAAIWNGPLWTGLDPRPHANAIAGTPLVHRIERLMRSMPEDRPATIWLVAPMRSNGAHILRLWCTQLARDRRHTFRLLGHLRPAGTTLDASLELSRSEHPTLTLGRGMMFASTKAVLPLKKGKTLEVDRLWRSRGDTWLFALDVDDAWAIRVPRPEDPAEVLPEVSEEEPEEALEP